jgi:hypothetical protein
VSTRKTTPMRRARRTMRKFFVMSFDYTRGGRPGFSLRNLSSVAFTLPVEQRGFPEYPETPCFLFDKRVGTLPLDLEQFDAFWFVSDRAKAVLQTVDPSAFAFCRCKVELPQGEYNGPDYWLCDVVRALDALDEARSRVKIRRRGEPDYIYTGEKLYDIAGGAELVFKQDIIGDSTRSGWPTGSRPSFVMTSSGRRVTSFRGDLHLTNSSES